MNEPLSQKELRRRFHYDAATGLFTRRVGLAAPGGSKGNVVGSVQKNGYIKIGIDRRRYYAHRLAWFYVHGTWPPHSIDHIDGNPADNRITNLRCAAQWQNAGNQPARRKNPTGLKGVTWHADCAKWAARIRAQGHNHYLGLFVTKEEAHAAYSRAAVELFGEFARS